jgi:hypothetical protein
MAVCKQVWAGEDVTIEGYGYSARGVRSVPASLQRPHPPLWLHANTSWGTDWVVAHGQAWMGMIVGEERIRTLRTVAIPTIEDFADRVDDVFARCETAGRDPATMEIVNNGIWPMLDIRRAPNAEQMRDDVGRLAAIGTDWVCFNLCGDDPNASMDSLEWFAANVLDT